MLAEKNTNMPDHDYDKVLTSSKVKRMIANMEEQLNDYQNKLLVRKEKIDYAKVSNK